MKKNILLSGILLLSFSCAIAQDYHDDVVVLDSVKVMSFNIRFNNPNDSLDTAWDRRREPCARMMAQYRPDVIGIQEPRNEMWQQHKTDTDLKNINMLSYNSKAVKSHKVQNK